MNTTEGADVGGAVPAGEAQHDGTAQPHAIVLRQHDEYQVWTRAAPFHATDGWWDEDSESEHYLIKIASFDVLNDAFAYRDALNELEATS
jgi:hypothetical protein